MFIDSPVIPTRLETLLNFFINQGKKEFERSEIYRSFQPDVLPEVTSGSEQAKSHVNAAKELFLIEELSNKKFRITDGFERHKNARKIILEAFDIHVLANAKIEPYFAPFYSYLLGNNSKSLIQKDHNLWANEFNKHVYGDSLPSNRFNHEKLRAYERWWTYLGLGWFDADGIFHCNPYERILRKLRNIFGKKTREMKGDDFILGLSKICPELDGGEIFLKVNKDFDLGHKECTLGLSHALIELHLDGRIRLHCYQDSKGWSIQSANPPIDRKTLKSTRIDLVDLLKDGEDPA